MTDDKKREAEVAKNIQVAIVYGANELAKTAATLGEKVWWRMVREDALTRYHTLGGVGEPEHGVTILRLEYPQTIAFTANDIDLMRKCVAEHDAKTKKITAAIVTRLAAGHNEGCAAERPHDHPPLGSLRIPWIPGACDCGHDDLQEAYTETNS